MHLLLCAWAVSITRFAVTVSPTNQPTGLPCHQQTNRQAYRVTKPEAQVFSDVSKYERQRDEGKKILRQGQDDRCDLGVMSVMPEMKREAGALRIHFLEQDKQGRSA